MTIYTEFRKTFTDIKKLIPLKNIIHDIQYGKYQDQIKEIQNEPDEKKQKKLKKKLPSFKPTLNDGIANGIIQLEIDPKDNPDLDINETKKVISNLQEIVYCFLSPRKGLKFALLSDFEQHNNDISRVTKDRYVKAYNRCADYILSHIDAKLDDSLSSIIQDCFVSFDPDVYFNNECERFVLNEQCQYVEPVTNNDQKLTFNNNDQFLHDEINYILSSFIPRDLKYDERIIINWSVFNILGDQGFPVLFNHWTKKERDKLKEQLHTHSKYICDNDIGTLKGIAQKSGVYKTKSPVPISYKFPEPSTKSDANIILNEKVKSFFDTGENTFLNISTGFGKSEISLTTLKNLPKRKNVLWLVKEHDFMAEIYDKYKNDIKLDHIDENDTKFQKILKNSGRGLRGVSFIKGKNKLCKDCDLYKKYDSVPIPKIKCENIHYNLDHQHPNQPCEYINQFDHLKNVWIMTHDEYFNNPSQFQQVNLLKEALKDNNLEDKDKDKDKKKSKYKTVPKHIDYIIIDENVITATYKSTDSSYFKSIRNIISDLDNDRDIETESNIEQIKKDYKKLCDLKHPMSSNKINVNDKVTYKENKNYIDQYKDVSEKREDEIVLTALYEYLVGGDESILNNFDYKFDDDGVTLFYHYVRPVHKRHKDIPVLFLDATANREIVMNTLGRDIDINYQEIKVKQNDNINVYQLADQNITKSWLMKPVKPKSKILNYTKIVEFLKSLKPKYDKIGFITYKNINGKDYFKGELTFAEWLSKTTGITLFKHFGNLRGTNDFEDVDCLVIIGRQCIDGNGLVNNAKAIYKKDFDPIKEQKQDYVLTPIKMKSGQSFGIINYQYQNADLQNVAEFYNRAETIQAIGRSRLIHGSPKDVFLLSFESMGEDVEITDFIYEDEIFPLHHKYDDGIELIKEIGYVQDKQAELIKIGISEHYAKQIRKYNHKELLNNGMVIETISFTTKSRNKMEVSYFVYDTEKFENFKNSIKATTV